MLSPQQMGKLNNVLHELTEEAASTWDEVAEMFPKEMSAASFFSLPKKHTRKPDSDWDHIVRGKGDPECLGFQ